MRTVPVLIPLLAAVALSGCGGMSYRDTNAAVDARHECASGPLRPGETPPSWCERKVEADWKSDRGGEKVDFKKKDGGG